MRIFHWILFFITASLARQSILSNSASDNTPSLVEQYAHVVSEWNINDLKEYLKDSKASIDEKRSKDVEFLRSIAIENLVKTKKQTNSYWDSFKSLFSAPKSYLESPFNNDSGKTENVSDWIFETWSSSQLNNLLKDAGIKVQPYQSRSSLIDAAKKNYGKISKKSKASGKYPGAWLYNKWSNDDLVEWLLDNEVIGQQEAKRLNKNRNALLKKVRDHIYSVSAYYRDLRDSLIEDLDLDLEDVSQFKDDTINSWSESQLLDWLKIHKIKVDEQYYHNKDYLSKKVSENKALLKDDVESWLSSVNKVVSPYLSKSTEQLEKAKKTAGKKSQEAGEFINDTFLIDVSKWSRSRLTSYLKSRGIRIPLFATKSHLVKLVEKNRSTPPISWQKGVKDSIPDWIFEGWSTAQVENWLKQNNVPIDKGVKKRDDLIKKAIEWYGDAAKTASKQQENIKNTASEKTDDLKQAFQSLKTGANDWYESFYNYYNSWSEKDLKKYLKSYGIDTTGLSHTDLINQARSVSERVLKGTPFDTQPSLVNRLSFGYFDKQTPFYYSLLSYYYQFKSYLATYIPFVH
ncbi:hypothetical protein LJB42_003501 [Komagataella kurtzmanii]|nr:hypothetical protein LJB42_003501 [Komagataella kurtzmanii]